MTDTAHDQLRRSDSISTVWIKDGVIIYDPASQCAHRLNPTAAAILDAFAVASPIEDATATLAQWFETSPEAIRADVETTAAELTRLGLIGPLAADTTTLEPPTASAARSDPGPTDQQVALGLPCYEALGWRFTIRGEVEPIGAFLRDRLQHLAVDDGPAVVYTIEPDGDAVRATCSTGDLDVSGSQAVLASDILWHVNRTAIDRCTASILLHAGAVATPAGVIAFPAPSNNGKSTLMAGLVREGFRYVTDEALAIDTTTGSIWPYPKPIGIDPGSFPLFPEAAPDPFDPSTLMTSRWWVPPAALTDQRPAAADTTSPLPLCAVVFPTFAPDRPTELRKIDGPEALMELLQNAFNMRRVGQVGLDRLAAVATTVPCFTLQIADLSSGIAAVRRVVARG